MKYTIRAVDRAGDPWTVCQSDSAESVLEILKALRYYNSTRVHWRRSFWPQLTDDEEAGDIESRLEEQEAQRKAKG